MNQAAAVGEQIYLLSSWIDLALKHDLVTGLPRKAGISSFGTFRDTERKADRWHYHEVRTGKIAPVTA